MPSRTDDPRDRKLLFPVGALVFSPGIDRLMREGRLDPLPWFQRHVRTDWGDITDEAWEANNAALLAGGRLDSLYVVTRELSICITTAADRSVTTLLLPSEY